MRGPVNAWASKVEPGGKCVAVPTGHAGTPGPEAEAYLWKGDQPLAQSGHTAVL
jgi:hypothetical protein